MGMPPSTKTADAMKLTISPSDDVPYVIPTMPLILARLQPCGYTLACEAHSPHPLTKHQVLGEEW